VTITIIGMLLVFFSLALISLIIGSTPYLLKLVERFLPVEDEHFSGNAVQKVSESEVVVAISAALCHSAQSANKQL